MNLIEYLLISFMEQAGQHLFSKWPRLPYVANLIALRPIGGRRPEMNFSPVVDNYSQSPGFSDGSRIRSEAGRSVSETSNTCWPVNFHKKSSGVGVGVALVSCSVPDT